MKKTTNYFWFKKNEDLTARAQHLIETIGGITELLTHYKKHHTFLNIRNCGKLTSEDLCSFCEYLLKEEFELKITPVPETEFSNNIDQLINIYESERRLLSLRVRNALDEIERKADFSFSKENKEAFFRKYFLSDFNFVDLRNIGKNSRVELQTLRNRLQNKYVNTAIHVEVSQSEKIAFKIDQELSLNLAVQDVEFIFIEDQYCFSKLFCIALLMNKRVKDKTHDFLKLVYFNEKHFDRKELGQILNRSAERARQLQVYTDDTVIPQLINKILMRFEFKAYDLLLDKRTFLHLENLQDFVFNDIEFTPNTHLSKIAYKNVYSENYILIDELIQSIDTKGQSFDTSKIIILVAKDFITQTNLNELLSWLDVQIFDFETISFDYRLDTLIERFYNENNLTIEPGLLKDLNSIVKKIKKDSFEFEVKPMTRILQQKSFKKIMDEVYLFMKEKQEVQKTKPILDFLYSCNYEIDKYQLLRHLHLNRNIFIRLGNGYWGLKENYNENIATGTLRKIIEDFISKSNVPVHISVIHDYINTFKNVSYHSLRSNLKADDSGLFIFFNCSYVGLKEKQYSDFWYKIPEFRAGSLKQYRQRILKNEDSEKVINEINFKYGYPKQHIEFILNNYGKG